jgi:hypothetical protein
MHRILAAVCLLAVALGIGLRAAQADASKPVEIAAPNGKVAAQLLVPAASGKVPVVVLIAGSGADADALAAQGIASLRYSPGAAAASDADPRLVTLVADAASCISFLRNDARFSTITVAERGAGAGSLAARSARADAFVAIVGVDPPASVKALVDRVRAVEAAPQPRRPPGARVSLRDTVVAKIDGSVIGIEYGRPSKRGRAIWGGLVPWGRWWMPGADEASTLTTSDSLVFGTLVVPKGEHTIYTVPDDLSFTLIINNETGQFHTVYHPDRDLGRVPMSMEKMDPIAERLTFAIEPRPGGGGVLKLIWDDRAYVSPFTVRRGPASPTSAPTRNGR